VVAVATAALSDLDFGLTDVSEDERADLFEILRRVRLGAGDVAAGETPAAAVDER
jgi:hypothetical protein